jgi:geranylgeranyl diphosphate synthase type II
MADDFDDLLAARRAAVERALEACLRPPADDPTRLWEAMRYSVLAGGKRVRPILVLLAAESCGGTVAAALPAACAVELAHTASIIHDDLPALDNDDLRRGRPTCHRAFDEATALLAGDGLEALAFDVLALQPASPLAIVSQVRELARAIGPSGMAVGEAVDVEQSLRRGELAVVEFVHLHKTAALWQAGARMGGMAAGADEVRLGALGLYGERLGLAFQVVDDILDVTGGADVVGKRTGKDAAAGKLTYPGAIGLEPSRAEAARLIAQAIDALLPLGERSRPLVLLAQRLLDRAS